MSNEEIIKRQIDEAKDKLEKKYGEATDRVLLHRFSQQEKEIIWDWMNYQQLYSLQEGYLRAKKDFKSHKKTIL